IRRTHLTELPQPLVAPGWEEASGNALIGVLADDRATHHWCDLDGLTLDDSIGRWFRSRIGTNPGWSHRPLESYFTLTIPDTWEALRANLKPHIKKNLRNSHAALARDGHHWTFDSVTGVERLDSALAEFFRLHHLRAAASRGARHPDHFSSSKVRAFLRS